MDTTTDNATAYIINTTKDAHVVGDLQLSWAGYGETYEDFVRAVSREEVQGSMGLQRLLATGVFKEISHEEMIEEIKKQGEDRSEKNSESMGNPIFDGEQMTEITPDVVTSGGVELDSNIDTSQRVDSGLEEDLPPVS